MTVYAALLRGINLGPTNKIAMPRLKAIALGLGWSDVLTYINSGNVVFGSTKKAPTLERELAGALAEEMGKPIDVTVRSQAQLDRVVAGNPFPDGHPSRVNVAFLMAPLPPGATAELARFGSDREPFVITDTEIYVHYQDGLGRSKLAEKFSSVVRVSTTTRTMGSVTKIAALCERVAG